MRDPRQKEPVAGPALHDAGRAHLVGVGNVVGLVGHGRGHLYLRERGHAVVLVTIQVPHSIEGEVVADEHVAAGERK